ncbi:MAG: hypothetical protein ACE37B_06875 [Ilumatobacter sp.]|uniref:hypothetical protein n=1 Tax=Ilumatobacter sp. TaxID=1967498 RepID=UPI00391CC92D
MPTDTSTEVRIPRPALVGIASGLAVSLTITWLDILPTSEGHAVLVAAIATPYLVFALLDGSVRSFVAEIAVMIAFVTTAFLIFDSPAWVIAAVLAAHGLWDLAHLSGRITSHVGDYPIWCGTLDITAAIALLITGRVV